jgi:hypothetical protein
VNIKTQNRREKKKETNFGHFEDIDSAFDASNGNTELAWRIKLTTA